MSEYKIIGGTREAVIIGINKYGGDIPDLKGAENDAREIYDRLMNPEIGNFRVSKGHFLIGEDAKCEKIRHALSDLFWSADPADLVLFYFSGHGVVDGYGNLYLAPQDMIKAKPFVYGISTTELKRVISSSKNKKAIVIFLDCCHSGIATEGEKDIIDVGKKVDEGITELSGEGIYTLASSEGDQKSREDEFKHLNEEAHHHGNFSYRFIEGLDGRACDNDNVITLDSLWKHLDTPMGIEGKQKPKFSAIGASGLSDIKIAIATQQYDENITKKIEDAKRAIDARDPTSANDAINLTLEVLKMKPKSVEALDLKEKINKSLEDYRGKINEWLLRTRMRIKPQIGKCFDEIEKLPSYLSFDKIITLTDERKKNLLFLLCEVSIDPSRLDKFIEYCKTYSNPPSQSTVAK